MSRFTAQLKSAVKTQSKDIDKAWRGAVAQAFTQVIQKTPVDTGAARASWLIGFSNTGGIGTRRLAVTPTDIPKVGSDYLLYSNLPYIERLEDGWSQQAPVGMVKITVADWPTIVARFD